MGRHRERAVPPRVAEPLAGAVDSMPSAAATAFALMPPGAVNAISANVPVTQPDDDSEREADAATDLVVPTSRHDQRGHRSPVAYAPNSVWEAIGAPGRALVRHELPDGGLGVDLSRVRIHTGSRATESARALNTAGYTLGSDIVLADGYDPRSAWDQRLIVHELAHVAENAGSPAPYASLAVQRSPAGPRHPGAPAAAKPPPGKRKPGAVTVGWEDAAPTMGAIAEILPTVEPYGIVLPTFGVPPEEVPARLLNPVPERYRDLVREWYFIV